MDPFSAILLIGLVTVATVKSAGSAVTDGLAQAKGQTPPSLEKWRAKNERRRERGEQPREDPGGLRRIWQQHTEAAAEKSAAKHRGVMEYLRDHGDDIATRKKTQLERAARRREYLGGKLAQAGGSSWDAMKRAAAKAAEAKRGHDERKLEEEAWRENERRGAAPAEVDADDAVDGEAGPDATVLSFTRRRREDGSTEVEVTPDGDGSSNITADGSEVVVHDDDLYTLNDVAPERRLVLDAQQRRDAEAAESTIASGEDEGTAAQKEGEDALDSTDVDLEQMKVRDPDKIGDTVSVAELRRRREREAEERRRAEEAERRAHAAAEAQAEREHRERLAELQAQQSSPSAVDGEAEQHTTEQHTTTDFFGGATVTTHSGEITDLTSAITYVTAASEYCDAISGTFETAQAQATATAQELEGQLGGLETAQSSLRSFEMNQGADRMSRVHERYSELVQAMEQMQIAATAAQEAISAAKSELDDSADEFQSQMGISEQINGHEDVANDTRFYAYQ